MFLIGNQTSCWAAPLEPFEFALAQKFTAFEWFPDKKPEAGWDDRDLDRPTRASIRQQSAASGVRLSVHARWQANPLLAESRELLARDLQLARELGATLLNIHLFEEQGIAVFANKIGPLIAEIGAAGMQLSIENTPHHSPEQFNELFARLREANLASINQVGMCFDMGHANLASATRNNFLGFLDRLEPQVPIIHLHLHENWGDADSHLPLFTGPSASNDSGIRGMVERLKKRKFSGSLILEQWPKPPSLLKTARDRLLEIWGPSPAGEAQTSVTKLKKQPALQSKQSASPPGPRAEGIVAELVASNQEAKSWREKLELVRLLVTTRTLTTDDLITLAIYFRFLGTGEVHCEEDGRHFRPAHHAQLAAEIYQRLAQLGSEENAFVLREIYPWLPSFDSSFRRAEPLTRIRDIAHRNDIPAELKRELKTTLQNKLHRCAGPEDLVTSAALLKRIHAQPAQYSPAFVEQFEIFHQELEEFFNARSLEQHLSAVKAVLPAEPAGLVDLFLQQKAGTEHADRMAAFETMTRLRRELTERAIETPGAENQALALADIRLEQFAFVLLSQILNDRELESQNLRGAGELLVLAVENLALSGVQFAESRALQSELRTWNPAQPAGAEQVLRWRASLLRCRRLAEEFGTGIIQTFSSRARFLGQALGVEEHAIQVYCEATIRSHLVFQMSKLADMLLRQTRNKLGLGGWDVLVPGRTVGTVSSIESLGDYATSDHSVVAVARAASGDEEIPKEVVAVVLGRELPHLSHLAVRARQAAVILVTCEAPEEFAHIREAAGRRISLAAEPDKVCWKPVSQSEEPSSRSRKKTVRLPSVRLSAEPPWVPLEQARQDNAGGKAEGARRLSELAGSPDAGFRTPPSLVIPFGVMEAALQHNPQLGRKYAELVGKAGRTEGNELTTVLAQLRELLGQLTVPPAILEEARRRFKSSLVVRSSANGEDLEEFAGAGLYESVINVPVARLEAAVRTVWASLWTQRAAESRRATGIAHEQAHMAILIQEMVAPEFSFVLHTVNPFTQDQRELYAEVVVGLGETLVSGATAGSPYRLSCSKDFSKVNILGFANLSQALRPARENGMRREVLDYSKIDLSRDPATLKNLGRQLCAVGSKIEQAFGRAQDIEGAVRDGEIYVVQARAQQGLARGTTLAP